MSIELIWNEIKLDRRVVNEILETVIEGEVILPDNKPDITAILHVDCDAAESTAQAGDRKISVSGILKANIIYASEGASHLTRGFKGLFHFKYDFSSLTVRNDMRCKVVCSILHIESEIVNSRKVGIKALLQIACTTTEDMVLKVPEDIRGPEDLQVLRKSYPVFTAVKTFQETYSIKESLDIPMSKQPVFDVVRVDYAITGREYKLADNKIIAKGELTTSILYLPEDENDNIQYMEFGIPFAKVVDIPDTVSGSGDLCSVEFKTDNCRLSPVVDSNGEYRIVELETELILEASIFSSVILNPVVDAYGLGSGVNIRTESVMITKQVMSGTGQLTLKQFIELNGERNIPSEILCVICKPVIKEQKVLDKRINIEGSVMANVLYLAEEAGNIPKSQSHEIPFVYSYDMEGARAGQACEASVYADFSNFSMTSSQEIDLRLTLGFSFRISDEADISVVDSIEEVPSAAERAADKKISLTVYFVRSGDSLWSIAKKYKVMVADIMKKNGMTVADKICAGDQLFIPRG